MITEYAFLSSLQLNNESLFTSGAVYIQLSYAIFDLQKFYRLYKSKLNYFMSSEQTTV